MKYIATFHSHFGATRFSKSLREADISCVLKPVPRRLSSSCGTCALFESERAPEHFAGSDVDGIYEVHDAEYSKVWSCSDGEM